MTRPGFRKGHPAGGQKSAAEGDRFLSSNLFTQAQILHLMKNEFARARRHGVPMGVALLQVDRIAQLSDLHGAVMRQTVKQSVARLVRDKTRGSDLLGTTNDDRYLLVMPHTDLEEVRIVCDRLHAAFGQLDVAVDGNPLLLTASIGLTSCVDKETLFFDSLLSQAEAALEHARQSGGDQVVSFGETHLQADALGDSLPLRDGEFVLGGEDLPLGDDDFILEDDRIERRSTGDRRDA